MAKRFLKKKDAVPVVLGLVGVGFMIFAVSEQVGSSVPDALAKAFKKP